MSTWTEPDAAPGAAPNGPGFVREVMTTGVVTVHEHATFKEVVAALVANRISAVPVLDADRRVVGVVSESDLLTRVSRAHRGHYRGRHFAHYPRTRDRMRAATARTLMTSPAVVTTTPDVPITDAARSAAEARVRRLPVVDSDGVLVGIVTRADLLRPFLRPDAEIRDDIVGNVIVGMFVLNAHDFTVDVDEGVVRLRGQVEHKSSRTPLLEAVRAVGGVVDVDHTGLTYRYDDSPAPAAFRSRY